VILILIYFAPKGRIEIDSGNRVVMGTFAKVLVVAKNRQTALKSIDDAFSQLAHVEKLMSVHLEDSEIARINNLAAQQPVEVSNSTFTVLKKSVELSRLTNGAFDITVGPLIDLWKSAADANQLPTDNQLAEIKSLTGYEKLILNPDDNTVQFAKEGMKIDLGGIAKGYAIDKAVEAIKTAGATGALVDVGGDIRCFGQPTGTKKHWLIGLQNPDLKNSDVPLMKLKLTDSAVATSGNYQRFYNVQGQTQSHIINTATGKGSDTLASVTIIAAGAIGADALATAVSVLGAEKGLKLIESITDTEAILISTAPDYKITTTKNAKIFIE